MSVAQFANPVSADCLGLPKIPGKSSAPIVNTRVPSARRTRSGSRLNRVGVAYSRSNSARAGRSHVTDSSTSSSASSRSNISECGAVSTKPGVSENRTNLRDQRVASAKPCFGETRSSLRPNIYESRAASAKPNPGDARATISRPGSGETKFFTPRSTIGETEAASSKLKDKKASSSKTSEIDLNTVLSTPSDHDTNSWTTQGYPPQTPIDLVDDLEDDLPKKPPINRTDSQQIIDLAAEKCLQALSLDNRKVILPADLPSVITDRSDTINLSIDGLHKFGLGKLGISRAVVKFTKKPVQQPMTVCFHFPSTYLTHKFILEIVKNRIHYIHGAQVTSLQFVDRNVVHGCQELDNRWIITLSSAQARDTLVRMGLMIYNKRVTVKLYDEVIMQEYHEYQQNLLIQKRLFARLTEWAKTAPGVHVPKIDMSEPTALNFNMNQDEMPSPIVVPTPRNDDDDNDDADEYSSMLHPHKVAPVRLQQRLPENVLPTVAPIGANAKLYSTQDDVYDLNKDQSNEEYFHPACMMFR